MTEERKKQILEVSSKFFDEVGQELNEENGSKITLDKRFKKDSVRNKWSINVFILTEVGITAAYYRGENKQFTAIGFAPFDVFLSHVPLVNNKFITKEQFDELRRKLL